eukprot:TRINITY_DN109910_c0_g1_i1.p1 TRINITY_DN109910_c0_g1~~TRINITY_DN109910_c0_g1_i1.p1  ORF type:complete len:879 (-),score=147.10 TRINITY_DN109910_c0_g1_i1:154-2406(-)
MFAALNSTREGIIAALRLQCEKPGQTVMAYYAAFQRPTKTFFLACAETCNRLAFFREGGFGDPTPFAAHCYDPPSEMEGKGSQTVVMTSAKYHGEMSDQGLESWVAWYPQVEVAKIRFLFTYELEKAPSWFFVVNHGIHTRGGNDNAMTVFVDQDDIVKYSFREVHEVVLTVREVLNLAGHNLSVGYLQEGVHLSAEANCFAHTHDVKRLKWNGQAPFEPSATMPLCIVEFDLISRSAFVTESKVNSSSVVVDYKFFVRLDARSGASFHRVPDLGALIMTLISIHVLVRIPKMIVGFVATRLLGPLSKVYKRTTCEQFSLDASIGSMGPQLLSSASLFEQHADVCHESQDKLRGDAFHRHICRVMKSYSHDVEDSLLQCMTEYMQSANARRFGTGPETDRITRGMSRASFADSSTLQCSLDLKLLFELFDGRRRRSGLEWWCTPEQLRAAVKFQNEQAALSQPAEPLQQQKNEGTGDQRHVMEEQVAAVEPSEQLSTLVDVSADTISSMIARLDATDAAIKDIQAKIKRLLANSESIPALNSPESMDSVGGSEDQLAVTAAAAVVDAKLRALETAIRDQQKESEHFDKRLETLAQKLDASVHVARVHLPVNEPPSLSSRYDSIEAAECASEKTFRDQIRKSEHSVEMLTNKLDSKMDELVVKQLASEAKMKQQAEQEHIFRLEHGRTEARLQSLENQVEAIELRMTASEQRHGFHAAVNQSEICSDEHGLTGTRQPQFHGVVSSQSLGRP